MSSSFFILNSLFIIPRRPALALRARIVRRMNPRFTIVVPEELPKLLNSHFSEKSPCPGRIVRYTVLVN